MTDSKTQQRTDSATPEEEFVYDPVGKLNIEDE